MAGPTDDFAALVARAREGDDDALIRLVRQYEAEVRLVARVQLGPALRPYLDSFDLVQSVHKSLLRGLRQGKFDLATPQNLVALALAMVRNKAARHWRHLRRQQRQSGHTPDDALLPEVLAALTCTRSDPAGAAAYHDAVACLWGHVTEPERRVLELRLEGCSAAEIARRLGEDADVLRVRLNRLRQRLWGAGVLSDWI
jgi:RNA polymerase sigma-70 factor (ECF subfamily)